MDSQNFSGEPIPAKLKPLLRFTHPLLTFHSSTF
jgi:hypothetical protein